MLVKQMITLLASGEEADAARVRDALREEGQDLREVVLGACRYGSLQLLKLSLEAGASLDVCDDGRGASPLIVAARSSDGHGSHIPLLRYLIETNPASVDVFDSLSENALFKACECGDFEAVTLLLEAGSA
jgi:ankyrin repeat protein